MERATANFVERGRSIAQENPEIEPEMLQAVDEVLKTGEVMSSAAREFASDPCSSVRRGNMVKIDLFKSPYALFYMKFKLIFLIQSKYFLRFELLEIFCPR